MGQPLPRQDAETGQGPVLDLAHLRRMTLGDDGLAREVLSLFDSQAAVLTERMQSCETAALATLAHTLKGSAVGIGAMQVVHAAQALEQAGGAVERAEAVVRLTDAVAAARSAIGKVLRG